MASLHSARDLGPQELEPSLAELQRRLDERGEYPLAEALRAECRQIRSALASWPQLVSEHVARQLWDRVETIRRLLDVIDHERPGGGAELSFLMPSSPSARADRAARSLALRPGSAIELGELTSRAADEDESRDYTPGRRSTAGRGSRRRAGPAPVALLPGPAVRPIAVEPYAVEAAEPVDPRLAVLHDPEGRIAEAYRSLFFRARARSDARSWLVTTVSPSEEGSVCAANLALAAAGAVDEPVLLVEARFAEPRLAELFGIAPEECFARRLGRHMREPDAPWPVARLADSHLHLLAVAPEQETALSLDATALQDVLTRFAARRFAYVIVDAPAVIGTPDAPYLARCAQGAILALHAGTTHHDAIQRARLALEGTPLLGYVLIEP